MKLQYADGTFAAGSIKTAENGTVYEQPAWEMINGAWYAFGADGYTKSGFFFDHEQNSWFFIDINSGMKTGWQQIENNWYYFDGSGAMKTDWILLGKTWYYMEPDGKMVTGRQTIREKEYYFDASGAMKTGWIKLEGKDCYYNPDGALMKDTWIGDYYVDETGAWIPNKFKPKWIKDKYWLVVSP